MKIDSWDDIKDKIQGKKFAPSIFQGTPLAYYDKDVTPPFKSIEPVVVFEDGNQFYIGYSNGDRTSVPSDLKTLMNEYTKLMNAYQNCPENCPNRPKF